MGSKLAEIGALATTAIPARGWCDGKVRFERARLAHEVIARSKRRYGRNVYRCPTCGGWHIGTSERWQVRPGSDG